jgi:hypothetical protein
MMQNRDYTFKILLLLLVIGVWGLLVSPFIGTYASQNTGLADRPAPATPPQTQRQYSVWVEDFPARKLQIGTSGIKGTAIFSLSLSEMVVAVEATPSLGWKVHSVVNTPEGPEGYVVIVEK